jgi:hypothetical protein
MSPAKEIEITISSELIQKKKTAHLVMRCLAILYHLIIYKLKMLRNH